MAPHVEKGLVDLLGQYLLAAGGVSEGGEEGVVAVLVEDCSGFGIEEEELPILLRADHEALFGRQDHLQLYIYITNHPRHSTTLSSLLNKPLFALIISMKAHLLMALTTALLLAAFYAPSLPHLQLSQAPSDNDIIQSVF